VNIASRMESHGMPNRIQISAATRLHLQERFQLEPHGCVDIKGKGPMETFILLGRRSRSRESVSPPSVSTSPGAHSATPAVAVGQGAT